MVEKKKVITKTVNRTGKNLIKKALVVKNKKAASNLETEKIKKLNEKKLAEKNKLAKGDEVVKEVVVKKDKAKEDKEYELTIGLKDLLGAGCHLGHKVSKTHPKARENIYMSKDGIEIFDLVKTMENLKKACTFIYNAKRNGKQIILVGTKRQSKEVIKRVAMDAGVPYVIERWLGGTITNWEQIRKNIKKLVDIKSNLEAGKYTESTKKEISEMKKEVIRLERIVGGLTSLDKLFEVVFVVDAGFEKTAIREARLKGIKIVAMVDTDANPFKIDFPIPANDDSVKSVNLIVEEVGKAIKAAGVK
jgi:small subunit ribosomal protein S2